MSSIVEATIQDLSDALSTGELTATELVAKYLLRIAKYDWHGIHLNSIPVLNSDVFHEAAASDDRRTAGSPVRPLEGIPYTVKDNIAVRGMTAAAGSPAFHNLVPKHDAFVVERLREAGAVLVGRTNMPPMAAGGMQRGLYGRAESPYNMKYLTAAFASGSSNGSATSTAASFAAFGLGSETVSSGRSPASNNALVLYTPSRGLISTRGLWPLYATCDVVTPMTRSVQDMWKILDILVTLDSDTEGDFWRQQDLGTLRQVASIRQSEPGRPSSSVNMNGKRIGVPKMFIGMEDQALKPSHVAESVIQLWNRAKQDLESMGATVVETEFPVLTNYEATDSSDLPASIPGCTAEWFAAEREELLALTWERFLRWAGDPAYPSLQEVDADQIFPKPGNYLPDQFLNTKVHLTYHKLVQLVREGKHEKLFDRIDVKNALEALEAMRKRDLEDWMDQNNLDIIVFPANGDVGRADIETNPDSARDALRNGVKFSHGNRVLRHLGIPTVSVSMGVMSDSEMPVNLTFVGRAYQDSELLKYAHAYEQKSQRRIPPRLTPALASDSISTSGTTHSPAPRAYKDRIELTAKVVEQTKTGKGATATRLEGFAKDASVDHSEIEVDIFVNGDLIDQGTVHPDKEGFWHAKIETPSQRKSPTDCPSLCSNPPSKTMVIVLARSGRSRPSGDLILLDK